MSASQLGKPDLAKHPAEETQEFAPYIFSAFSVYVPFTEKLGIK